ncbi:MAG: TIGR04282 family arsenosugar biosynthesis glycosyltransferase [Candidatus Binatia bacterium]
MPTRANALAVMAKAPIPGMVKTRLVPPLTNDQAAELSGALLADLLDHVQNLSGAERYLFFAPDYAAALMSDLAGARFHLLAQRGADLGARMQGVFTDLWARGYRRIVLIGGDLPGFPLNVLEQAFAWLDTPAQRVVLGPSRDGGYYLAGMNSLALEIFAGMTWSHSRVLSDTLEKIKSLRVEAMQLPLWFDVDTPADLAQLRQLVLSSGESMKNTAAVLRQITFY